MAANALQQTDASKDLRTALEEASVLSEELQAANEELLAANEALDQRVAQRTLELGHANAELGRINAELNRRVEVETSAGSRRCHLQEVLLLGEPGRYEIPAGPTPAATRAFAELSPSWPRRQILRQPALAADGAFKGRAHGWRELGRDH